MLQGAVNPLPSAGLPGWQAIGRCAVLYVLQVIFCVLQAFFRAFSDMMIASQATSCFSERRVFGGAPKLLHLLFTSF